MTNYINDYSNLKSSIDNFRVKLTGLLIELIDERKIDVVSIEGRTKSVESFKEKISRQGKNYKDPLVEITDLCGIRIITYYTEDIYRIAEIIEEEFKIDPINSIDKTQINSPDKFGYQSLHFVVNVGEKRDSLTEWRNFKHFNCEIQVRSILQHSWAAIDHKLRYKSKGEIPTKLKRRIYRLSALLELADEEFLSLKHETANLYTEIESSLEQGNLNLEINYITISTYLDNNAKIKNIVEISKKIGFIEDSVDYSEEVKRHFLSRLISCLKCLNITTINALDKLLDLIKPNISNILESFINKFKSITDDNFYAVGSDLIVILIILRQETKIDLENSDFRNAVNWEPMLKTFDELKK